MRAIFHDKCAELGWTGCRLHDRDGQTVTATGNKVDGYGITFPDGHVAWADDQELEVLP